MGLSPTAMLVAAAFALPAGVSALPVQDVGPWVTRSAVMEADLTADDGSAEVTIRYRLAARDPAAALPLDRPVPLSLLDFGPVATEEVAVDGRGSVVLWPTVGSHRTARVEPPLPAAGPDAGQDGTLELVFRYRVEEAVVLEADGTSMRVRVPVLAGPAVSAEEGETAFRATLTVPPRWSVTEGFPSGLDATEEGRWEVSLQVVPSVVGFRGRADGSWRPGVPLVVDVLTVLILLVFAGFGWRHLREVAA